MTAEQNDRMDEELMAGQAVIAVIMEICLKERSPMQSPALYLNPPPPYDALGLAIVREDSRTRPGTRPR